MYEAERLAAINPDLTLERMAGVDRIIERYRGKPGNLIPVLEECQGVVGYLPIALQEYIAHELNIPGSTVYGVVTFYSFFSMVPKGRHTIKVCMGTACYVRGTRAILERLKNDFGLEVDKTSEDRRFTLKAVRCLGACGLAPAVVIDEDTHGGVRPDKVENILKRYQ
ncbi:MAG: NAD(P)H-dependent oxidoreductase subunit E [Desulfatiglandales bacterium]